jgi:hypothetical protein
LIDLSSLIVPIITSATQAISTQGIEAFFEKQEGRNLRDMLRERLLREMRFNSELLSHRGLESIQKVDQLDARALEFVFSQPLPLKALFPRLLSEDDKTKIAGSSQRAKQRINGLLGEADLIERVWLRMSIAKFRARNGLPLGDVDYLSHLIIGLRLSLSAK